MNVIKENILFLLTLIILMSILGIKLEEIISRKRQEKTAYSTQCFMEKKYKIIETLSKEFKLMEKRIRDSDFEKAKIVRDRIDKYCPKISDVFIDKLNEKMRKEVNFKLFKVKKCMKR